MEPSIREGNFNPGFQIISIHNKHENGSQSSPAMACIHYLILAASAKKKESCTGVLCTVSNWPGSVLLFCFQRQPRPRPRAHTPHLDRQATLRRCRCVGPAGSEPQGGACDGSIYLWAAHADEDASAFERELTIERSSRSGIILEGCAVAPVWSLLGGRRLVADARRFCGWHVGHACVLEWCCTRAPVELPLRTNVTLAVYTGGAMATTTSLCICWQSYKMDCS
jgi:hypothetical protein